MSKVRTRFAPSPSGFLHIGGARTALFNYLFAHNQGGRFVVRIEDTDRQRSAQEFVDAIFDGLSWLGLDSDEEPVFQSARREVHQRAIDRLTRAGACYWCFCSPERLDEVRKQAQTQGRKTMYDRTCRDLGKTPSPDEQAVLRFRSPLDGETVVNDMVRGVVTFDNAELDDLILLRSDGTPTFHLVVVADDIDMGITHCFRGEDHLTNTPRQMLICRALGAEPPVYGHLPLIVGKDRARLSKRHGATSVSAYRDQGFLPGATLNYLARLGWSHGDDEIFTKEKLVELFDVAGINSSAAAFDLDKFTWVNFQHQKRMPAAQLAALVRPFLDHGAVVDDAILPEAVELLRERAHTLVELAEGLRPFTASKVVFEEKSVAKFLTDDARALVGELAGLLDGVDRWSEESIESAFRELIESKNLKLGTLAQPVRVALTGGTQSPGIFELCRVLGRGTTLARLRAVAR